MLEKSGLLILPWTAVEGSANPLWTRAIRDAANDGPLGLAQTAAPATTRQSWWRGWSMQVLEGPDAALLMTVYRPFGILRMWQVLDAEEHRTGSFYRQLLCDGVTHPFAQLRDGRPGKRRPFVGKSGIELGSWEVRADGSGRLSFAEPFNPFLRMILLAKVLAE